MKVASVSNYSLYIYADDHSSPHCHVRFKDGSDVSVDIPSVMPRYGATISREVEEFILQNLDALCDMWERLNERKNYNIKKPKK